MRLIYFDTSAWNALTDRDDRLDLIQSFRSAGTQVFASVISIGEILRTRDPHRRAVLCEALKATHGETSPILDHPDYLLRYAAEAAENDSVLLRESNAAILFSRYVSDPSAVTNEELDEVSKWILSVAADYRAVRVDVDAIGPRLGPRLCSPEILESVEFNELLVKHVEIVRSLAVNPEQMMSLGRRVDIWSAFRASVACALDYAFDGVDEPGGVDLRQAIYLGACDTFVLRDREFERALREIATAAGLSRDIVRVEEFFAELVSA